MSTASSIKPTQCSGLYCTRKMPAAAGASPSSTPNPALFFRAACLVNADAVYDYRLRSYIIHRCESSGVTTAKRGVLLIVVSVSMVAIAGVHMARTRWSKRGQGLLPSLMSRPWLAGKDQLVPSACLWMLSTWQTASRPPCSRTW